MIDIKEILQLAQAMRTYGIAHLELKNGGDSLILDSCTKAAPVTRQEETINSRSEPSEQSPLPLPGADTPETEDESVMIQRAILVGTVHLSSASDSEPLPKAGERVRKGQTVCLLESMKMFNEITAPEDGILEQLLVTDGQAVEYNQPLFKIHLV